jgi:hypothetical protein
MRALHETMLRRVRSTHMKPARFNVQIDPALLATAEKAAAETNQSLNSLIEKLLADYCKRRVGASEPSHTDPEAAPKAAEMASRTIDAIADKTLPPEEQQQRKKRLIRGPTEFRDLRKKEVHRRARMQRVGSALQKPRPNR